MSIKKTLFNDYLKKNNYSERTIVEYHKHVMYFKEWCNGNEKKVRYIKHIDIVNYIDYLRKRGIAPTTIDIYLNPLKQYFNYLDFKVSPLQDIDVIGRRKKVLTNILTEEQLTDIYLNTSFKGIENNKQCKVLLGLVCFQGIKSGEELKIKVNDIDLYKATMEISEDKRTNGRTMYLRSIQIFDIIDYLNTERERRIKDRSTDLLILGDKYYRNYNNVRHSMISKVRNQYKIVINWNQLRDSRIVSWIKQFNIRETQYLCGHKHISSTEKYKLEDIEDLKEKVELFHPM